jgi:hypothetical protein
LKDLARVASKPFILLQEEKWREKQTESTKEVSGRILGSG